MSKLAKALTAAAGNAGESLYVEDVFSTYLVTGTGTAPAVNNGIDLSGEGGLVWLKKRSAAGSHDLFDTARGENKRISTNTTNAEDSKNLSFTSTGFSNFTLDNTIDYASWSFRKAEKFFDVVTWTGNGDGTDRNYNHNLNSVPNCVIVKRTDASMDWGVYHSQLGTGGGSGLKLNTTDSIGSPNPIRATPSSTQIKIRGASGEYNENGATYVAYLFASDAGGFGDDGSESIIKCGSWDATGNNEVNLGFEPQWILIKNADGGNNWGMFDSMRGWTADGNMQVLAPNLSSAESSESGVIKLTSTGFTWIPAVGGGNTYIYIAIRRPMKTPESGTEVFKPTLYTGNSSTQTLTGFGFPADIVINKNRSSTASTGSFLTSRLTGGGNHLRTNTTQAELTGFGSISFDEQDGITLPALLNINGSGTTYVDYAFKRATGFFDVVAYTGDGQTTQTLNHNLGVTPDIIVVKKRSTSGSQWPIIITSTTDTMYLNTTNASFGAFYYIDNPTSTTFDVQTDGSAPQSNQSGETYIAYLFATLAGVSKVGSYTGTGADLNVDCGFSAGARFILIKRTDSTGDWYVWDSVRGIVAGNDPYLLLNSTAAEVTSTDYIDPLASGFTVTSTAPAALNASGGTYIFLAIA